MKQDIEIYICEVKEKGKSKFYIVQAMGEDESVLCDLKTNEPLLFNSYKEAEIEMMKFMQEEGYSIQLGIALKPYDTED